MRVGLSRLLPLRRLPARVSLPSLAVRLSQLHQRTMSSAVSDAAPTALIPVADGTEEIEAVTLADVLVRGGVSVTLASVGQKPQNIVRMSRGVRVQADEAIEACANLSFDVIVVPGGLPGATNLRDSPVLTDLLKRQKHEGKWYGFEKDLDESIDYKKTDRIVVTGKCVTSQGPGTAMEMGVKLVELLCGKEKAAQVAKGLLIAGAA